VLLDRLTNPPPGLSFARRWCWPLFLVLPFVSDTLSLGQVNLIACGSAWCPSSRRPRRDTWAGLALAVAAIIKIFPLVFLPFWLIRGRWRLAASARHSRPPSASHPLLCFGPRGAGQAYRDWWMRLEGRAT